MPVVKLSEQAASARAVAEANGLEVQAVTLIGGYANTMFKLEPLPLVARVAAGSQSVRQDVDWLAREIAVAQYLERVAGRAIRPARLLRPGPHLQGNYQLSFWEYVRIEPRPVTPVEIGKELRTLHILLEKCPAVLPEMGALNEVWRIWESSEFWGRLSTPQKEIVSRRSDHVRNALAKLQMEKRPLHGDAHHGNLWPTADGLIWGDFEDAHNGPIEWDLACMTASSHVFGDGRAATVALKAYAARIDSELLDVLIEGRTLQAIAWSLVALPELETNTRFLRRLKWLDR
jgi:Phosphotransferase enzyme family